MHASVCIRDTLKSGALLFVVAATGLPSAAAAGPLDLVSELGLDPQASVLAGVMAGSILFAVVAAGLFVRATQRNKLAELNARRHAESLSRERSSLQSLLAVEPQIMVRWENGAAPEIAASTLDAGLNLPENCDDLLNFGSWLEKRSAILLQKQLDQLVEAGTGFSQEIETQSGLMLDVTGRASGSNAVLKIKEASHEISGPDSSADQGKKVLDLDISLALFDAIPLPVWFRDRAGKLSWVNQAYTRSVDAANSTEVCQQQLEFLSSRQRDAAMQKLEQGETYSGRIHAIVSGSRRAFEVVVQPVGNLSAGIAIDVAALETAESELSRHIEEHTRTLDNIATAVAIFSPEKRLEYFNQAYSDIWKLDPAWLSTRPSDGEILDKLRSDRVLPEEADYKAWKHKRLDRYDETSTHEDRWHLPDGRTIHVIANYVAGGSATFLYENITEELALKSSFNALIHVQKETLDHLREGVAVFGTDGRLKLFNSSFAAIWKLNVEALGKEPHIDEVINWCRVLLDDDAAWDNVKQAITSIDDTRDPLEGTLSRPDGSILAYAGLPLPDGATLLTYIDISDSKRVELALIERNEALEAADRLKSAFIGHVSYELRTPLTNIIGFSDMLTSQALGTLNDRQKEYLTDIQTSSDDLLTIINDILDLATIDAGTFDLAIASVKAADVIEAAVTGVRENVRQSGLELSVNISDDAQDIIADARRLTQVLYNLLSNAIGFSEQGGSIAVNCRRDGEMIAISVEDKGRGIPEDYQESAFNPFETRPQGSEHRGTGLGLTIVKSLVELHGGKVSLASAPGVGTTVTVRLPSRLPPAINLPDQGTDDAGAPPTAATA